MTRALLLLEDDNKITKKDKNYVNKLINEKMESNIKKNSNIFETKELSLMLENKFTYCKVGIDVKASAFQILGLILKKEDILAYTRFYEDKKNNELDIYEYFLQALNKANIKLTREVCKKILMTLVYNQQAKSRAQYLQTYYASENKEISFSQALKLSNEIYKIVNDLWPYIIEFQKLIASLAKSLAIRNKAITIPIYKSLCILKHMYYGYLIKRLTIFKGSVRSIKLSLCLKYPIKDKTSIQKYLIATLPNMIHSLDASLALLTIKQCMKHNIKIFTVHDCFYVHPCHVKQVQTFYYEACKKVFNKDDFWQYFINTNDFTQNDLDLISKFMQKNVDTTNKIFEKKMHPNILM